MPYGLRCLSCAVADYTVYICLGVRCRRPIPWSSFTAGNVPAAKLTVHGKNGQLTHSPIIQAISLHTLVHTYCSRRRQPLQMITKPDARKPRVSQDDFAVFPSDSIGALAPIGRLHLSTDMATTISLSLDSEPHGATSRLPLLPTYITIGQPRLRDSSLRRPSL
jgi:hypothetical protein